MNTRNANKRARLPALPPVSAQDASMRAWMQAVTERLEVREGQRGNGDERVLTQRDLAAFRTQGDTQAAGASGWWVKYQDIDSLAAALRGTTMHDDLLRRIANASGEPIVTTREAGTTVVVGSVEASSGTPPDALRLVRNDLDFYRLPTVTSRVESTYQEFVCTVNTSGFFSMGGNHVAFAIDCSGGAGNGHPHYGQIIRNGSNLFEFARGFIVFANGQVLAEHWNGTFTPGLSLPLTNTVSGTFSPATTPIFTVRITAGYRLGAMANHMAVAIHSGGASGPIVFAGSVPWGWDWTGTHISYVAAIGNNFVSPNETGNVERVGPGLAPDATVRVSGAKAVIA